MKRVAIAVVALALLSGGAWAKLPAAPMTDEQKAKAEEAKAKAAEAAKKEAEQLGKAQDKAVANYKKTHAKASTGAPAAPAKAKK